MKKLRSQAVGRQEARAPLGAGGDLLDGPDFMEETRDVLLGAFYRVLNQDAALVVTLAEMHGRFPGLRWQEGRLPADAEAAISVFIKERPWLPRGALHDMFGSLDIATEQKAAPELRVHRIPVVVTGAPPPHEPIAYDPLTESPQDFLARAKRHVRETEAQWKALGRKPIHVKHRSQAVLSREAHRVYRRAVLGWNIERIADEEQGETGDFVDPETVRTSIRRWSRILGIKRRGEVNQQGRMRQTIDKGPMPLACQGCRTRNMAPDARYITYRSKDQDAVPLLTICEGCATNIARLVTS